MIDIKLYSVSLRFATKLSKMCSNHKVVGYSFSLFYLQLPSPSTCTGERDKAVNPGVSVCKYIQCGCVKSSEPQIVVSNNSISEHHGLVVAH